MESLALIIPIHPKHYNFIYNLIDITTKNPENNIDIFLIFSNEQDYNIFNKKDFIKEIILPPTNTNSIVTYKKFYALENLKNEEKYNYFIVCDAEISIIPENFNRTNILNKINKIYENKLIYAGNTTCATANRITKDSASIFINNDVDKLKKITNNFQLYYWWSDLPVYKREHLTDFFNKICHDNMVWNNFDNKIYLNYLILYHNFNILNLSNLINHYWSLESYNTNNKENLIILKNNNYGFSWATPDFLNNHKDFLMKEGCCLLYHLDR
jgi:hypothetical protein